MNNDPADLNELNEWVAEVRLLDAGKEQEQEQEKVVVVKWGGRTLTLLFF